MFVEESFRTYAILSPGLEESNLLPTVRRYKDDVNTWLEFHLFSILAKEKYVRFIYPAEDTLVTKALISGITRVFNKSLSFNKIHIDTYSVTGSFQSLSGASQALIAKSDIHNRLVLTHQHVSPSMADELYLERDKRMIDQLVDYENDLYYGGVIAVHDGGDKGRVRAGMKYAYNKGLPILSMDAQTLEERRVRNDRKNIALTGNPRPAFTVPVSHTRVPVLSGDPANITPCPYCGSPIEVVTAAQHYGSNSYQGSVIRCTSPSCDAAVGTHKDSNKRPLGTMANQTLRKLRNEAHQVFDKYWQYKPHQRQNYYIMLSYFLNIPIYKAHIGQCNERQCLKIIEGFDDFIKYHAYQYGALPSKLGIKEPTDNIKSPLVIL